MYSYAPYHLKRHFGDDSVKSSLHLITTQKITNLQNDVSPLQIIVFSLCHIAYHHSDILVLLQ